MTGDVQRAELAGFLRARREAADPLAFGVARRSRSRTPGLRREEIAQFCGLSVTWYTWLEQAREIGVSRGVFERLAETLRLSTAERAHLFNLAGLQSGPAVESGETVDPLLARLVDTLDPNPAYVVNPWWDVLACNSAHARLFSDSGQRPAAGRNSLWSIFVDGEVRARLEDWRQEVRRIVGQLRANLARFPTDGRGRALVEALLRESPEFAGIWAEGAVLEFEPARKRLRPPGREIVEFDYLKLSATPDHRQQLIVFLPVEAAAPEDLPRPRAWPLVAFPAKD